MSGRSYKDAIDRLNTLQSNAATLDAAKAAGGRTNSLGILEMIEYLERIGYKVRGIILSISPEILNASQREDLNSLNVLHVTGTKGKGSTCAFVDSILRHTKPEWKIGALKLVESNSSSFVLSCYTGLYTSPHLVAVRERIRINGVPISEELFAKFFFDVWDRLEDTRQVCSSFRLGHAMC
jgi:folylpolyglutamate synthase